MVRGGIVILALLAACGGGKSEPTVLLIERQPGGGTAGSALPLFVVRVESGSASSISIELDSRGTLPSGRAAGLGGTLTAAVVNDRASFDGIVLTGAASGYRLRARGGGAEVVTAPFEVEPGPAFRLAFLETPPDTPVGSSMGAFRVAVLDRWDNFATGAGDDVTLDIDAVDPFGRDVLLHASGPEILELLDCEGPYLLAPEPEQPGDSIDAMTFDEGGTDRIWATTASGSLLTYDLFFGGGITTVGSGHTLAQRYTGLYFDGDGVLWGLPLDGSAEVAIDTTTGRDDGGSVAVSLAGETIEGFQGAAVDAVSGALLVAARLASSSDGLPRLLSVDENNVARIRGILREDCASLATKFDGVSSFLYAASPDPDPALYEVNPLSAAMTYRLPLGNGGAGEAIAYVFPAPADIGGASFVQRPVDGVVTFAGFRWTLMASGVTFVASAPGLQPGVSNPFDVTAPDTGTSVSFTTSASSVAEDAGTIGFDLTLSRPAPHDLIVIIEAAAFEADTNLPAHSRNVIFAGETSLRIAFEVLDDAVTEPDEQLTARISGVALGTVGPGATHTITIRDND